MRFNHYTTKKKNSDLYFSKWKISIVMFDFLSTPQFPVQKKEPRSELELAKARGDWAKVPGDSQAVEVPGGKYIFIGALQLDYRHWSTTNNCSNCLKKSNTALTFRFWLGFPEYLSISYIAKFYSAIT